MSETVDSLHLPLCRRLLRLSILLLPILLQYTLVQSRSRLPYPVPVAHPLDQGLVHNAIVVTTACDLEDFAPSLALNSGSSLASRFDMLMPIDPQREARIILQSPFPPKSSSCAISKLAKQRGISHKSACSCKRNKRARSSLESAVSLVDQFFRRKPGLPSVNGPPENSCPQLMLTAPKKRSMSVEHEEEYFAARFR